MRLKSIVLVGLTLSLSACIDTNVRREENMGPLLAPSETSIGIHQERPSTYIKRRSKEDSQMSRKVTLTSSGMPLARVLSTTVPNMNVRIADPGVDLGQTTVVYANNMPLDDFLDQLTDMTGYAFVSKNGTLTISSSQTKTWNLAPLASNRQSVSSVGGETGFSGSGDTNSGSSFGSGGGSGGGLASIGGSSNEGSGTTISSLQEEDQWLQLMNQIRSYLGLEDDQNADEQVQIGSVRSIGTVTVTAPPDRIKRVDTFLSTIAKQSKRQVHLDVKAFEVTLNDSRARGINWDAVLNTTFDGSPFQVVIDQNNPIALQADSPSSTNVGVNYTNGNDSVGAMVNLLSQYGTVSLLTEPNLSTLNGGTAYLSSVDEFSFISSVTQFLGTEGTNTVTPQLDRIRVGVTMAVTPRILPDDRILIEVTPVISSLQGFDAFNVGDFSFSNPRIALSELSTQVITRPGEPVQLGGLITSRVANEMNRLPLRRKTGLINWLFSSEANELERREMVISITPTLTEV
ncbi:hypothetical protein J7355_13420 [Endozoicomonas sp. G2_2]|uniref:hypothetical protein n=1 Tax=Endozoicomonas sp. G2_2 TaxID=2821092 RepID=UPI001ADA2301|nr:hypothetical protein [Endozoicomonas sp. G2_2]MBO9471095.1 hypothetical protein [Endozoicomonas sp. G2_2]